MSAFLESKCGDSSGVWKMNGVSDGGNRVISVMSLWCLYCWHWVCFTASSGVSFVDFERVIADCSDMPLLHWNFLTGVNSLFTLIIFRLILELENQVHDMNKSNNDKEKLYK